MKKLFNKIVKISEQPFIWLFFICLNIVLVMDVFIRKDGFMLVISLFSLLLSAYLYEKNRKLNVFVILEKRND